MPPFPLDRDKLEKIVLNLLSNAIRFTDGTESRPGAVTVRCSVRTDRFVCSVEDTGIGIPDDEIERVFDRFHQVQRPATRGRGGSGIGLALVRQLAEFHMGTVTVRSRVGEGSCFTLELPVDRAVYPPERLDRRQEHVTVPVDRRRPPQPSAAELHLPAQARPPPRPAGHPRPRHARGRGDEAARARGGRQPRDCSSSSRGSSPTSSACAWPSARRRRSDAAAFETPALVVSDVMMPGRSGTDLLRDLRRDPRLRGVPVILVTAKADLQSKIENLQRGRRRLPREAVQRRRAARAHPLAPGASQARRRARREERVPREAQLRFRALEAAGVPGDDGGVRARRRGEGPVHARPLPPRVAPRRARRARAGLSEAECETIRIAGILHDVGKIGTPESVLAKPGKVTPEEYEIFKRHAQMGWRIVSAVKELDGVARAILHHHERFDGAGYPEGIAGLEIPVLSRILAVCDTYDAMTSDRPYRAGVEHRLAVEELLRCSGSQLDPECVQAFLRLYEDAAPHLPGFPSALRELATSRRCLPGEGRRAAARRSARESSPARSAPRPQRRETRHEHAHALGVVARWASASGLAWNPRSSRAAARQ